MSQIKEELNKLLKNYKAVIRLAKQANKISCAIEDEITANVSNIDELLLEFSYEQARKLSWEYTNYLASVEANNERHMKTIKNIIYNLNIIEERERIEDKRINEAKNENRPRIKTKSR